VRGGGGKSVKTCECGEGRGGEHLGEDALSAEVSGSASLKRAEGGEKHVAQKKKRGYKPEEKEHLLGPSRGTVPTTKREKETACIKEGDVLPTGKKKGEI